MTVQEALKEYRKRLNVTLEDFCAILDIKMSDYTHLVYRKSASEFTTNKELAKKLQAGLKRKKLVDEIYRERSQIVALKRWGNAI
jgi:transcriptional regulator with XRE-family HTH domain